MQWLRSSMFAHDLFVLCAYVFADLCVQLPLDIPWCHFSHLCNAHLSSCISAAVLRSSRVLESQYTLLVCFFFFILAFLFVHSETMICYWVDAAGCTMRAVHMCAVHTNNSRSRTCLSPGLFSSIESAVWPHWAFTFRTIKQKSEIIYIFIYEWKRSWNAINFTEKSQKPIVWIKYEFIARTKNRNSLIWHYRAAEILKLNSAANLCVVF